MNTTHTHIHTNTKNALFHALRVADPCRVISVTLCASDFHMHCRQERWLAYWLASLRPVLPWSEAHRLKVAFSFPLSFIQMNFQIPFSLKLFQHLTVTTKSPSVERPYYQENTYSPRHPSQCCQPVSSLARAMLSMMSEYQIVTLALLSVWFFALFHVLTPNLVSLAITFTLLYL